MSSMPVLAYHIPMVYPFETRIFHLQLKSKFKENNKERGDGGGFSNNAWWLSERVKGFQFHFLEQK